MGYNVLAIADVQQDLSVGGSTTLTGTLTCNGAGASLTVANNATVGGSFGVIGITVLTGSLTCNGVGTSLAVTNKATVGGALAVTGETYSEGRYTTKSGGTGVSSAQFSVSLSSSSSDVSGRIQITKSGGGAWRPTKGDTISLTFNTAWPVAPMMVLTFAEAGNDAYWEGGAVELTGVATTAAEIKVVTTTTGSTVPDGNPLYIYYLCLGTRTTAP